MKTSDRQGEGVSGILRVVDVWDLCSSGLLCSEP